MPNSFFKTIKSLIVLAQIFVAAILISQTAFAKEITVFDVRRAVSLENNHVMPKDFYINAGAEVGLKVGLVVAVNRRQTLYDPFQGKSPGDLVVPVGRLRIIHVQDNIAVARMVEIMGRDQLPGLEFDAIMVGDRLDMSTARMGKASDKAMSEEEASASGAIAIIEIQETTVSEAPVVAATSAANEAVTASAPTPTPAAQVAESVAPVAAIPVIATATAQPTSVPAVPAPTRESSSQSPATTLPTQGPTL